MSRRVRDSLLPGSQAQETHTERENSKISIRKRRRNISERKVIERERKKGEKKKLAENASVKRQGFF